MIKVQSELRSKADGLLLNDSGRESTIDPILMNIDESKTATRKEFNNDDEKKKRRERVKLWQMSQKGTGPIIGSIESQVIETKEAEKAVIEEETKENAVSMDIQQGEELIVSNEENINDENIPKVGWSLEDEQEDDLNDGTLDDGTAQNVIQSIESEENIEFLELNDLTKKENTSLNNSLVTGIDDTDIKGNIFQKLAHPSLGTRPKNINIQIQSANLFSPSSTPTATNSGSRKKTSRFHSLENDSSTQLASNAKSTSKVENVGSKSNSKLSDSGLKNPLLQASLFSTSIEVDPLDAFMAELVSSGDVQSQRELPSTQKNEMSSKKVIESLSMDSVETASKPSLVITYDEIMKLQEKGKHEDNELSQQSNPDMDDIQIDDDMNFDELRKGFESDASVGPGLELPSLQLSTSTESDLGMSNGLEKRKRKDHANVKKSKRMKGFEENGKLDTLSADDILRESEQDYLNDEINSNKNETEEEREAREIREKEEFLEAFRKARKEEEAMREKLVQLDQDEELQRTAKAQAVGSVETLGRIYGGDGDILEEYEIESKKKSALDIIEEAKKGRELKEVDHSKIEYMQFRKNLYIVPKALAKLTEAEVNDKREDLHIKVRGRGCPAPVDVWEQCGLSDRLLGMLRFHNLKEPFPIQKQAIPAIMCGRDVIGVAKTGSGKTLAFLLPMFRHIQDQPPIRDNEGPIGLIMAPARELAFQIYNEAKKYSKVLGMRIACVYGGAGVAEQIADLKRGSDIVVCTPGRMIDVLCMQAGRLISFKRVTMVVMDEADRMFDMGFEPQIKMIMQSVRPDRQTVLFSATFPKQIEKLAKSVLKLPLEIIVGERSTVNKDITQIIEVHEEEDKFMRLLQLLGLWYEKGSVLIFVDKQEKCDQLYYELLKLGYPCLSLHGGKDQVDRDHTLHEFKTQIKTVMIATSVAGRGLDVPEIVCVINFSCPNHLEDYVHRVGRTGRAGRKGTAYTFVSSKEEQYAPIMVKALEKARIDPPVQLKEMAEQFVEKVKRGEAHKSLSGFVGKGFTFDSSEMNESQKIASMQRKAYEVEQGLDGKGDEADFEDEDDDDAERDPSTLLTTSSVSIPSLNTSSSLSAATASIHNSNLTPSEKAKLIAAQLLAKSKTMAAVAGGQAESANPQMRALQLVSNSLAGILGVDTNSQASRDALSYCCDELDINDYPHQARRKVTSRSSIDEITDRTGVAIISRGNYVPPGKKPEFGDKRLHLLIEGSSELSVKQAKLELQRVLEEETLRLGASGALSATAGRYSVI